MLDAERLRARMAEKPISQSQLARDIGVSQQTIARLVSGNTYGSKHLHKIARELGTTPAYLTGETDDPDENAPPPRPKPIVQFVTLPIALPSEEALAAAYKGLLMASRRMDEDELARELAKRLPTLLRVAADAFPAPQSADHAEIAASDKAHEDARLARRRA